MPKKSLPKYQILVQISVLFGIVMNFAIVFLSWFFFHSMKTPFPPIVRLFQEINQMHWQFISAILKLFSIDRIQDCQFGTVSMSGRFFSIKFIFGLGNIRGQSRSHQKVFKRSFLVLGLLAIIAVYVIRLQM